MSKVVPRSCGHAAFGLYSPVFKTRQRRQTLPLADEKRRLLPFRLDAAHNTTLQGLYVARDLLKRAARWVGDCRPSYPGVHVGWERRRRRLLLPVYLSLLCGGTAAATGGCD